MTSSTEDSDWRVSQQDDFDGTTEDFFHKTSMHLSFTDYYQPYVESDGAQGQHDQQVFFRESIVSVHHGGIWVGDVDVLQCLNCPLLRFTESYPCKGCHHIEFIKKYISIETWKDIIDPPVRDGVIRAHGNWLGRLAVAVTYIQARLSDGTGDPARLYVLSENDCAACLLSLFITDLANPVPVPTLERKPKTPRLILY